MRKKNNDNSGLNFKKCICPHLILVFSACIFNSFFFLVFMKEKPKFQLNREVVQTKKSIKFLNKYSQPDQCILIVSTIHLRDENPIFRKSIQNISKIYICTAVLYLWINCIISLYCVAVLYHCFVEFNQITKPNYLLKFSRKFQKRGDCILALLYKKTL